MTPLRSIIFAVFALLVVPGADGAALGIAATARSQAGVPINLALGVGARVPFDEYEAEWASYRGTALGPDRRFGTLAAEASGRRAVRLDRAGDFVEFTLARPADALIVRYSIPDTLDGVGRDAGLSVLVDGRVVGTMPTTSRLSWLYGRYPFTNTPANGGGHHAFAHGRMLLGVIARAGATVRLRLAPAATTVPTTIDLADFERVTPPSAAPAGAVRLVDLGGDPSGSKDSGPALRAAVARATGTGAPVWIGPGTFRVDGHVELDDVTVAGAGMWWSVIRGPGVGLYGRAASNGARRVVIRDLSIIGEVAERRDDQPLAGIGGALSDSLVERVWLQHHKTGIWLDGPMSGIRIRSVRIMDVTADGMNLRRGVTDADVEDVHVRGSGDDGLAAWSEGLANSMLRFVHNTVSSPTLANGIAIYGGSDVLVRDNLVADTLTQGGGIHIGNRFGAVPATGRFRVQRNVVARAGGLDPNWRIGIGALWFYALDGPLVANFDIAGLTVVEPRLEAVTTIGERVTGVHLRAIRVVGGDGPAITLRAAGRVVVLDGWSPSTRICAVDAAVTGARVAVAPTGRDCGPAESAESDR